MFRIPYWTDQSVFIVLHIFGNIENYVLKYKCQEHNKQEQEIVVKDLRQYDDQLTEIKGLASGSLYEFHLRSTSNDKDMSLEPIAVKTSGEFDMYLKTKQKIMRTYGPIHVAACFSIWSITLPRRSLYVTTTL